MSSSTLLLTGFEPFGGDVFNPSGELAARLHGTIHHSGVNIHGLALPVSGPAAWGKLTRAARELRPRWILALGVSGRAEVSVESTAWNEMDYRIPDNAGLQPRGVPVLARRADNAQTSFTAAITFKPRDADLYLDRARAFALKPDWISADNDLTAALAIAPGRADLLVLRASARHALGKKADARTDIDQALKRSPGNADALEMRGDMKMEAGDQAGAKADWQAVVAQSPRSAAASTARDRLATLNQPPPAAAPAKH